MIILGFPVDVIVVMKAARIMIPIGTGSSLTIVYPHRYSEAELKTKVSQKLELPRSSFTLHSITAESNEFDYAVIPLNIAGAVDDDLLRDEYEFLRHQFPLVTMINLTTYEGMVRCEGGPIKELAEDDVWPFHQYTQWHKYRMKLSFLHPYKPPTVTWLTDIDHPNIIPKRSGKVCVSLLGKGWLPQTKLAAIVNSLHFLLFDPNPYSHYPNKRCTRAAEVCKQYGFPRKRGGTLTKHELTMTCPSCRRPFMVDDPDSKVIQCIHCKIILRRKEPEDD